MPDVLEGTISPPTPVQQSTPGVDEVTLGDKKVELSNFDRFKMSKGQESLIAIISSNLLRAHNHFFNKSTFKCLTTDPTKPAICCQQCGPATQKFGMVLFEYLSDKGEPVDKEKCRGTLKIWIVSEARYSELSQLHSKWPLLDGGPTAPQHDFAVKCTEEQYQRMNFTPCPSAHWKSKPSWYPALKAKADKAKESLKKALGKNLTQIEVMELLGASTAQKPGGTDNAGDIDLSDVLG
jgi:hypothetical protein